MINKLNYSIFIFIEAVFYSTIIWDLYVIKAYYQFDIFSAIFLGLLNFIMIGVLIYKFKMAYKLVYEEVDNE